MKKICWGAAVLVGFVASGCSSPSGGDPGVAVAGASGTGEADLCNKQYDAQVAKCGADESSRSGNVLSCQDDQRDFQGIGCKDEYDSWLLCTTKAGYDCAADTGCEGPQNAYFGCQSQAVSRTGCVRLGSHDVKDCTAAGKPYAFSCLGSAPSQCQQVASDGAGIWCCSQL